MLSKQMNNAFLCTRHGMFHPVPCVAAAETLASHFPQPRRKLLALWGCLVDYVLYPGGNFS